MDWKTACRSFYYQGAPEPEDLGLPWEETALLVIDVQNKYLDRPPRDSLDAAGCDELHRKELEILNMIYGHVVSSAELRQIMGV